MIASTVVNPLVLVALVGVLAGAASMFVYWIVSPQSRLSQIKARAAEARLELRQIDGDDVHLVWALSKRAIGLALQQVGLTLGPTLLGVGVVLAVAWVVELLFDLSSRSITEYGPDWLTSGHAAFWVPLCLAALWVKLRFNIE